jgi:cysteine desulfurase / selenocysteine lyase
MTTPTSTGDADGLPSWMPDEASLARLASEMLGNFTASEPTAGTDGRPAGADGMPTAVDGMPAGAGGISAGAGGMPIAVDGTPPVRPPYPGNLPGLAGPVSSPNVPAAPAAGVTVPAWPDLPRLAVDDLARAGRLDWAVPDAAESTPTFYFVREQGTQAPPELQRTASPVFDVATVRRDFPILGEQVHGRQLVWLDNAATTQKPQVVIDRLVNFYQHENSNVHRGVHALATRATDAYEGARQTVADFLGASSAADVVFTRGTTEAINLVAQAWGADHVGPGDEIVLSHLEHHANIVPWQQLAERVGARLKVIPVDDDGQLDLAAYATLLTERTRLVSVAHVSNVVGTVVPVQEIIAAAHRAGARVLVDGAQAVAHLPVSVDLLDADFYVFSGHKIFGPTGIGALYAKPDIMHGLSPWQGGGNMIKDVTFERTLYELPPRRFEAGTGSIADAAGLGTALDYVTRLGLPNIASYEHALLRYAADQMQTVPDLRLIGTAPDKASVLSFVLAGYTPEEVGSALDSCAIAVRAGHHCAQPILRRYGLEGAVRASLSMYNTREEVDLLVAALRQLAADAGRR